MNERRLHNIFFFEIRPIHNRIVIESYRQTEKNVFDTLCVDNALTGLITTIIRY